MRLISVLFAVLFVLGSSPVRSGPCEYRRYPVEFEDNEIVEPLSLCIYPDGRSSMADICSGSFSVYLGYLTRLSYTDGQYYYHFWGDEGLLLGGEGSSIALCDTMTPYLRIPENTAIESLAIYGGGHSETDSSGSPISSAVLYWAPQGCGISPIELFINSPDINGDLVVNIEDTVLFSSDYGGAYNYRSDFNYDGLVNMSDLIIFSGALNLSCSQ